MSLTPLAMATASFIVYVIRRQRHDDKFKVDMCFCNNKQCRDDFALDNLAGGETARVVSPRAILSSLAALHNQSGTATNYSHRFYCASFIDAHVIQFRAMSCQHQSSSDHLNFLLADTSIRCDSKRFVFHNSKTLCRILDALCHR